MNPTSIEIPTYNGETISTVGNFVQINGEDFYEITNYDNMNPFLMNVVSSHDHWMYLSSTGGLTAGRVVADNCLFPYLTVDQLHDCHWFTGPITVIRYTDRNSETGFWQPFCNGVENPSQCQRRLLKHIVGDEVIFEERDESIGLLFRYSWRTSSRFGFIRTATIVNLRYEIQDVEILDGIQNICPSGVPLPTSQRVSCLVDAYKHNEYDQETGLGIFSLTAQILDRPEAAEVLKASTAWCTGLQNANISLSAENIHAFYNEQDLNQSSTNNGQRGNYFCSGSVKLFPGEPKTWYLVADVGRNHLQIAQIRKELIENKNLSDTLEDSAREDHQDLLANVASADGLQSTGNQLDSTHHFANVLFNNMRGGVPGSNYKVQTRDYLAFINSRNHSAAKNNESFLHSLPEEIDYPELMNTAADSEDPDLIRLTAEYLPFTFSRRHGDPSRPWNSFEIRIEDDNGSRLFNYQGNWRDIFQNWEALGLSFPGFFPSMVAKFVNASTIDGFNPYRITRDGIDWETINPDDPWSDIGYWGDHQIIYLTKLLEAMEKYFPGSIESQLAEEVFCYANVPYRIKPFEELLDNPNATIRFDKHEAKEIAQRENHLGADGKLLLNSEDEVYYVNLLEKLLVPVLSKLSNLVVDGGIWLNTQRPEWNDANNALVGSGLSMVTVCYLRRHLRFLAQLFETMEDKRTAISAEVEQWFDKLFTAFQYNRLLLCEAEISDQDRGRLLELVGQAFSDYRAKVYQSGFSGKHSISIHNLREFFALSIEYLDHTIRVNRRDDNLFHAYNLLEINNNSSSIGISHLYEMLEGQVAVLSCGVLEPGEVVQLVDGLFSSKLYREDQNSFILYPERKLPSFLDRNTLSAENVESVNLLVQLIEENHPSLVTQDVNGDYHFSHQIQKLADLEQQLSKLAEDKRWAPLIEKENQKVFALFEEVFHHKSYTGRSGTMYAYEGLGSIYWHMVSKLLLAIQENLFQAIENQAPVEITLSLIDAYYRVRSGLSSEKPPTQYGAFPTDPYSHSPKHAGAQQPGMTGQVKEELLTRLGELGIQVIAGRIELQPHLLRRREFHQTGSVFNYYDVHGNLKTLELSPDSLAFTFCQVPFVYKLSQAPFSVEVTFASGNKELSSSHVLNKELSEMIFYRSGDVALVEVKLPYDQISLE